MSHPDRWIPGRATRETTHGDPWRVSVFHVKRSERDALGDMDATLCPQGERRGIVRVGTVVHTLDPPVIPSRSREGGRDTGVVSALAGPVQRVDDRWMELPVVDGYGPLGMVVGALRCCRSDGLVDTASVGVRSRVRLLAPVGRGVVGGGPTSPRRLSAVFHVKHRPESGPGTTRSAGAEGQSDSHTAEQGVVRAAPRGCPSPSFVSPLRQAPGDRAHPGGREAVAQGGPADESPPRGGSPRTGTGHRGRVAGGGPPRANSPKRSGRGTDHGGRVAEDR